MQWPVSVHGNAAKLCASIFLASTIPDMVWFARIEEIEGQNLKDNILVRFWSPQFVFLIFFENQCGFRKLLQLANKKRRRRRKEAVTDLKVAVCSPGKVWQ